MGSQFFITTEISIVYGYIRVSLTQFVHMPSPSGALSECIPTKFFFYCASGSKWKY